MHGRGREFQDGWRDSFEVEGVKVEVLARHHNRNRVPRGHEVARQASRGLPLAMVKETSHEWLAVMGGRRATVRVEANGRFSVPYAPRAHGTLREAVADWAGRELARRATRAEPPAETPDEPGPSPAP